MDGEIRAEADLREKMARINARLRDLEQERMWLLAEARSLSAMIAALPRTSEAPGSAAPPPHPASGGPPSAAPSRSPAGAPDRARRDRRRGRRDLSPRTVQNLLLVIGALLLAIAATVFTVVSWGLPWIRAGILVTITLVALAVPWPFARRGMQATAEAIALIGLALIPLDAIAVANAAGDAATPATPATPGDTVLWGAAGMTALLAAGWAVYARYAPLRLPAPTAIVLAQAPLPLAALAAAPAASADTGATVTVLGDGGTGIAIGAGVTELALALCGTAALDLLLVILVTRMTNIRVALAAGLLSGAGGVVFALVASFTPDAAAAARASGVLVLAGALAALTAWMLPDRPVPPEADRGAGLPEADRGAGLPEADRRAGLPEADRGTGLPEADRGASLPQADRRTGLPEADRRGGRTVTSGATARRAQRLVAQAVAGTCLVAALAAPPAALAGYGWGPAVYAVAALAVLGAAARAPGWLRPGSGYAAAGVLALTGLVVLPYAAMALVAPLNRPTLVWPVHPDAPLWPQVLPESPALPLVLAALAVAAATHRLAVRLPESPAHPLAGASPGGPAPASRSGSTPASQGGPAPASPGVSTPASLGVSTPASQGGPAPASRGGSTAASLGGGVAGLVLVVFAVFSVPYVAGMPLALVLAVDLGLAVIVCAVAAAARTRRVALTATCTGGAVLTLAVAAALARVTSTLIVCAAALVLLGVVAAAARTGPPRAAAAAGAVLAAGGVAWSGWVLAVADVSSPYVPFVLLGLHAVALWAVLPVRPPRWLHRATVEAQGSSRTVALGLLAGSIRVLAPGNAWRERRPGQVRAFTWAADALVVAAVPAVVVLPAGDGLTALAWAIAALLVAAGATSRGRLIAAGVLVFGAPLWLGDALIPALTGPYEWVTQGWTWTGTAAASSRFALFPGSEGWHAEPLLLPVLFLVAAAAVLAAAVYAGRWPAIGVARVVLPIALAPLPLAVDLSYAGAIAFLLVLTAGLAFWAAVARGPAGIATFWTGSLAVAWSLATRPATLIVLAALGLIAAALTLRARDAKDASAAAATATLVLGAEGAAIAFNAGLPRQYAAFVVLAIGAMVIRAAPPLTSRPAIRTALQAAGAALVAIAVLMASVDAQMWSLVVAIGGFVIATSGARAGWGGQARIAVPACALTMAGVALIVQAPALVSALVGPFSWVGDAWSGVRPWSWPDRAAIEPVAGPVAALAAGTVVAAGRVLSGGWAVTATIAVPPALLLLPVALAVPYPAAVAFTGALVVALAVQAARTSGRVASAAGAMAVALGLLTTAWSLAAEPPTLLVLGGLSGLAAGCALLARTAPIRTGAAACGTLTTGAFAAAAALAAGAPARHAAFAVLAVAAIAALLAAGTAMRAPALRRDAGEAGGEPGGHGRAVSFPNGFPSAGPRASVRLLSVPIEGGGYALAVTGVLMSAADPVWLSLALAASGLIALGTALRADRRRVALAGAALLQLALWIRLAAAGVTAPEPYTVPMGVAGLAGGWWLRRTRPVSSWMAFGPALALILLPSLVVAWTDPGLTRPILLGLTALTVTLAGAWSHLQAPLLIGGATLLVNAAHELGPALVELVGEGPRWAPIAVTGLALLFTGATYEHRLRDLRRLRSTIAGMR